MSVSPSQNQAVSFKYSPIIMDILPITVILIGLITISQSNYLLFHCLAEFFSIAIAGGIFMLAWNTHRFQASNYLVFIGIAYLFVGGIDLLHTLSYKGMGVFIHHGANLPTQLWIIARYMESLSLLAAPLFINCKLKVRLAFSVFLAVTCLLILVVFAWGAFPACFIEGSGLTPFKKISEYVISLVLMGAIAVLIEYKKEFDSRILKLVIASIAVSIMAELAFTFYIDVYGLSNMVGHLFKIISFYLIYKALIETGLNRPYNLLSRKIKERENELRNEKDFAESLLDTSQVLIVISDTEGRVIGVNAYLEDVSGFKQQELMGKDWFVRLVAKDQQDDARGWFLSDEQDAPGIGRCFQIITRLEVVRDIEWYRKVLLDADGKPEGVLCVGHDISELKKANEQLQDAMDKIKTLKGFLPICCSCKKIRDDKGYWNKLEDYISRHSDASFTHGICPDCMEKLYPEISSKKKKKN